MKNPFKRKLATVGTPEAIAQNRRAEADIAAGRVKTFENADEFAASLGIKKATYPDSHTFAEAVQYLAQGNHIDYEVKIDRHSGALMTRGEWLDAVESGSFIDYDGMGNQVDKDGNIIKTGAFGDYVYPSESGTLVPACAYILWYNK